MIVLCFSYSLVSMIEDIVHLSNLVRGKRGCSRIVYDDSTIMFCQLANVIEISWSGVVQNGDNRNLHSCFFLFHKGR